MAENATSGTPAVDATDGGRPRIRIRRILRLPRRSAPARLLRAARGWLDSHTCGHHWHCTGDRTDAWHCCACPATRDKLPARNGRDCTRPRLLVGGPLSA